MNNESENVSNGSTQAKENATADTTKVSNKLADAATDYLSPMLDKFGKKRVIQIGIVILVMVAIMLKIGVFRSLLYVGMIALIAGMIRPKVAARWITLPTRKKIFGIMLVYLIPVAAIVHFTKSQIGENQFSDSGNSNQASNSTMLGQAQEKLRNALAEINDEIRQANHSHPGCDSAIVQYNNFKEHQMNSLITANVNNEMLHGMDLRQVADQIDSYRHIMHGVCSQY